MQGNDFNEGAWEIQTDTEGLNTYTHTPSHMILGGKKESDIEMCRENHEH